MQLFLCFSPWWSQYFLSIRQPPHLSALRSRAWAWKRSCSSIAALSTPPEAGIGLDICQNCQLLKTLMRAPRLVNSICLGWLWTEAPASPHGPCWEQNWRGRHLNSRCLHRRKNPRGPMGRHTPKPEEERWLWLSAPIISLVASCASFCPTRCVNPTHLFLRLLWLEPGPLLLGWFPPTKAQSFTWHWEGMSRSRFLPGLLTSIHLLLRGQSPPRPAWLSTPSPTDLRAVPTPANTHRHRLAASPQLAGPVAQPSPCPDA